MKNKSLLMLLPLSLIVTGCSGNLKKGSLLNEKFMKQNFSDENGEVVTKYEYQNPEKIDLNLGEGVTVTPNMASSDILEVSKDGAKGYYSLATNTFAVPLSAGLTDDFYVNTQQHEELTRVFTGTKMVDGKKVRLVFDEYGNKLYEGSVVAALNGAGLYRISKLDSVDDEAFELRITLGSDVEAYAYYKIDRSFKEVITAEEYYKRNPYSSYGTRMSDKGHSDYYYLTSNSDNEVRYSVFNAKKGKYVSSFVIPESKNTAAWEIGDHLVYQIRTKLPERAEKFDYSSGEDKYALETFSVDMVTGKTKTLKTNLYLPEFDPDNKLKDEKGIYKYVFAEQIKEITKDKVLSNVERDLILDKNLKVCADVTGIGFMTLEPFDNKDHYVSGDDIIYDAKLKEVGRYENLFGLPNVVTVKGKCTIVDHTGKFLVPAIYNNIEIFAEDRFYLFETDDAWKFGEVTEKGEIVFHGEEVLKKDYEAAPNSPKPGEFSKFKVFIQKSDSKKVIFDVISGAKLDLPEKLDGSTDVSKMNTNYDSYTRLGSMEIHVDVYAKDGAYYAIRYFEKLTYSFLSV